MICKKQSAIIIINNKQSNLLLKNWLRLHSGHSLKNQLRLHSYFLKSLRLWLESTPTLRLLYTSAAYRAVRFWKILPRTSRATCLSKVWSRASAVYRVDVHLMMNLCKTKRFFRSYCR